MTHEFSQLNIFESYVVCILVGVNLEAEFVFCSISCWVGIIMLEFCVCLADGSPAISLHVWQRFGFQISGVKSNLSFGIYFK